MSKDIQFIHDADGNRTGAIIPIEEHEERLASEEEVAKEADLISDQSITHVSREELTAVLQNTLSAGLDLTGAPQAGVETEGA